MGLISSTMHVLCLFCVAKTRDCSSLLLLLWLNNTNSGWWLCMLTTGCCWPPGTGGPCTNNSRTTLHCLWILLLSHRCVAHECINSTVMKWLYWHNPCHLCVFINDCILKFYSVVFSSWLWRYINVVLLTNQRGIRWRCNGCWYYLLRRIQRRWRSVSHGRQRWTRRYIPGESTSSACVVHEARVDHNPQILILFYLFVVCICREIKPRKKPYQNVANTMSIPRFSHTNRNSII